MYVKQATVFVLAAVVFRANICVVMQRNTRKSPVSHTFGRYGQAKKKDITVSQFRTLPTI